MPNSDYTCLSTGKQATKSSQTMFYILLHLMSSACVSRWAVGLCLKYPLSRYLFDARASVNKHCRLAVYIVLRLLWDECSDVINISSRAVWFKIGIRDQIVICWLNLPPPQHCRLLEVRKIIYIFLFVILLVRVIINRLRYESTSTLNEKIIHYFVQDTFVSIKIIQLSAMLTQVQNVWQYTIIWQRQTWWATYMDIISYSYQYLS